MSLDLIDTYHNLRIADYIGHLFTFEIDGVYYQHVRLPMGWLLLPMIITKFMRPVISLFHCPYLLNPAWQELLAFKGLQTN